MWRIACNNSIPAGSHMNKYRIIYLEVHKLTHYNIKPLEIGHQTYHQDLGNTTGLWEIAEVKREDLHFWGWVWSPEEEFVLEDL